MKPILIKKESYKSSYGLAGSAIFTTYLFKKGNNEHFISNLVNGKTYTDYSNTNKKRVEMAYKLKELRKTNFKYLKFYCPCFDCPIEFIKWVKESNSTFDIQGSLLRNNKTFVDFHGNLKERSCSFMFRIYDKELLSKIKTELKTAKTKVSYKRKQIFKNPILS